MSVRLEKNIVNLIDKKYSSSNTYDPYADDGWGSKDALVNDLVKFIEDTANNADFRLAELREAQDKIDADLADIAEREAAVVKREKQLALDPDTRLKKAIKTEADVRKRELQLVEAQAKLQEDTTALRKKIIDADALINSKIEAVDDELEKKKETLEDLYTAKIHKLEKDFKNKESSLKDEEKRLRTLRHELSDVEAGLVARERIVAEIEASLQATGSMTPPSHKKVKPARTLEL